MRLLKKILVAVILLAFSVGANASIVEISVATDKPIYQLGEHVTVSITAYNPNPEPITLHFGSSLQATYIMDNTFNWISGKMFFTWLTSQTINAYSSYTWNLSHGVHETPFYELAPGSHSVVGEVVEYGVSTPVQFEVVPEPHTLLLLTSGWIVRRLIRQKRRNTIH